MKILIREGSAAKNFEALHPLFTNYPEQIMLCSDDKHPNDLINGHINLLVRRAIALGYDVFDVLKAANYNAIKHYNLECGYLQINQPADFIIVDNLTDFNICSTYTGGVEVYSSKENIEIPDVPLLAINNFNLELQTAENFTIKAESDQIRVIEVLEGQLVTNKLIYAVNNIDGYAVSDIENDVLKICVIDRYNNGKAQIGFIKNFGLKVGAIATSVAHDSHNVIAVACDDHSLATAVNSIVKNQGGMAVFDGTNLSELPLPIAGLMSTLDAETTAEKYLELESKAKSLGSELHSPFMTLSFMALLVIPKLKLGDKGLFDGEKFQFTNLFV